MGNELYDEFLFGFADALKQRAYCRRHRHGERAILPPLGEGNAILFSIKSMQMSGKRVRALGAGAA
jgi:hypothetical protein